MMVTDVAAALLTYVAAKADVSVPSVSQNAQPVIITIVTAAASALGGGGLAAVLGAFVTARIRKVRQFSDVREDTTVENQSLKDAAELAMQIAKDAREAQAAAVKQAKEAASDALSAARQALTDKDAQLEEQKAITAQWRDLAERYERQQVLDQTALADARRRADEAERREQTMLAERSDLEQRLMNAEAKVAELTLTPAGVDDVRRSAR